MQTTKLHIEVDASETLALFESIRTDLAALKEFPEFPIEHVLNLGDSLITQLAVGGGCATVVACDGRLVVQVVGVLEVFAAALAALKLYVHAVLPQRL